MQFLFVEYSIIRDNIDVIEEINLKVKLQRLKNKKTQFKTVNIVLATRK